MLQKKSLQDCLCDNVNIYAFRPNHIWSCTHSIQSFRIIRFHIIRSMQIMHMHKCLYNENMYPNKNPKSKTLILLSSSPISLSSRRRVVRLWRGFFLFWISSHYYDSFMRLVIGKWRWYWMRAPSTYLQPSLYSRNHLFQSPIIFLTRRTM